MRPDVTDFYNGISFEAHRLLGAHPAGAGRGWLFTVWAPHARRVQAVGDWNGWDLYHSVELAFCEDGLWRGRAAAARAGQLYKYNVLGADGVWRLLPDPFAAACEPLPGTASRLAAPRYPFAHPARAAATGYGAPLSIYEVHAASWRRHWDGRYYAGPALADALIPWVLERGYTHVEFLPLAEYPFDGSWGYQGCGYFSPSCRVGGFDGFAALVDRLHGAGIGVIMDFVPVHFAPDEGRLARWDGAPLYEAAGAAGQSEWGSLNFDLACGPVRSFLLSAAAFWLYDCRCDGLRVDAVGAALYRRGEGGPQAAEFFKTLTAGLHARFPGALLIAEDTAGALNATAPTRWGGLGFDYVWDSGFTRAALDYFAAPFDARPGRFAALSGAVGGPFPSRVINAFSHDENAWRTGTILWQLYGGAAEKFSAARLLYLLQFCRPGKKLNFMGNEFGTARAFDPYREADWHLLADGAHRALADYCAALGAFYTAHPGLYRQDDDGGFRWAGRDAGRGVLGFLRTGGEETLLCAFNLGPSPVTGFGFDLPWRAGTARPVFAAGPVGDAPSPFQNGRVFLSLPPLAGAVYRLES